MSFLSPRSPLPVASSSSSSSASSLPSWSSFPRYGRTSFMALARVEITIEQLHLLGISTPKAPPPVAPDPLPLDEDKPVLVIGGPAPTARSLLSGSGTARGDDVTGRGGRGGRKRRIGQNRASISAARVDGDDDDDDDDTSSFSSRRAVVVDASDPLSDLFLDRQLIALNPVIRVPGAMQLLRQTQVYGRTNVHLLVEENKNESSHVDHAELHSIEEGFYKAPPPAMSIWNREKLVARLTREDRQQTIFFEGGADDGRDEHMHRRRKMKIESYPVHDELMRAAAVSLYPPPPLLHTRMLLPSPYTSGRDQWYDFRIQLHSLTFTEHALFTPEDRLSRQLCELALEGDKRSQINLGRFYSEKIDEMRRVLSRQRKELSVAREGIKRSIALKEQQQDRRKDRAIGARSEAQVVAISSTTLLPLFNSIRSTLTSIADLVSQRDREESESRLLFKEQYRKWMAVRAARSAETRRMKAGGMWLDKLVTVDEPPVAAHAHGTQGADVAPVDSGRAAGAAVIAQPPLNLSQPLSQSDIGASAVHQPMAIVIDSALQHIPPHPSQISPPSEVAPLLSPGRAISPPSALLPPPPPPPPPEIPAPPQPQPQAQAQPAEVRAPLLKGAMQSDDALSPTALAAGGGAQQQEILVQQQQQQQYQQQMMMFAYQQQQMLAYQQQLQLAAQGGQTIMGPPRANDHEEEKQQHQQQPPLHPDQQILAASALAAPAVPAAAAPPTPAAKKGKHISIQDALDASAAAETDIDGNPIPASAAHAQPPDSSSIADPARSPRPLVHASSSGLAKEEPSRSNLLRATYVGTPSNFKVGRRALDRKKADDALLLRAEQDAWRSEIRAQVDELNVRDEVERCIANGGEDPHASFGEDSLAAVAAVCATLAVSRAGSIDAQMSLLRRRPGGTRYLANYSEDLPIFDAARCLPQEQSRRRAVTGMKIYLRLIINGNKVCDTEPVSLSFPSFKASFLRLVPLRLTAFPSSIVVHIMRVSHILASDEQLGECFLPVPRIGAPPSLQRISWAGKFIEDFLASSLSSSQDEQLEQQGSRYTSGVLETTVYWGDGDSSSAAGPEELGHMLAEFAGSSGANMSTRSKMAGFMSSSSSGNGAAGRAGPEGMPLDPNDPRNADALANMSRFQVSHDSRSSSSSGSSASGAGNVQRFRASESQSEGSLLPNPKYTPASARSKVLQARNESGFIREPVPLRDADISAALFQYIEVRDENIESEGSGAAGLGANHIGFSRTKMKAGSSSIVEADGSVSISPSASALDTQQMYEREQLRAQSKILQVSHDIADVCEVVNETELPILSVDVLWLSELLERRRGLRPKRVQPRAVSAPKSCNIVVQVVRGQNLPVRRTASQQSAGLSSAGSGSGSGAGAGSSMSLDQQGMCRTFVEISLQSQCKRTSCSNGANPRWDQLISLPFRPPAQSFSPAHLSCCTDLISFNVFDEIVTRGAVDPRLERTSIMHSSQRWLGSFTVPFTTIYNASGGKIEGAFSLNIPNHLLGYEQPHRDRDALLYIYATMDPVLATPAPQLNRFHLMNPFYTRALAWVAELKSRSALFAAREFMAVAGDISSQPAFICRYICAEVPPEGYREPLVFQRFVATIPFVEDAQASLGTVKDVWCTSKDFLALQGGDWEEHAILLCNYLTWHDTHIADPLSRYDNYVAIGSGFPEGDTAYVVRLGSSPSAGSPPLLLLINAVTGRSYDLSHSPSDRSACPMQSIGVMFNSHNIWANIQIEDDPTRVEFDLNNVDNWCPFFTFDSKPPFTPATCSSLYSMKFDTVQKSISYHEESLEWYVDRAHKLERLLERRIESWRRLTTHWDYGVCALIRESLPEFEANKRGQEVAMPMERVLMALGGAYTSLYGFPLHFTDSGDKRLLAATEENAIVAAVKNTKVHENEEMGVVFAIAVYIHPYPNRMGSVWVYIASMKEK